MGLKAWMRWGGVVHVLLAPGGGSAVMLSVMPACIVGNGCHQEWLIDKEGRMGFRKVDGMIVPRGVRESLHTQCPAHWQRLLLPPPSPVFPLPPVVPHPLVAPPLLCWALCIADDVHDLLLRSDRGPWIAQIIEILEDADGVCQVSVTPG